MGDLAVDKTAIRPHSTPTDDGAWDAGRNRRRLPEQQRALRAAHAWFDPEADPDTKAAVKFIHHFVDEDGTVGAASTVAAAAGIAVLNGGRGGADIPDGERRGVWRHLARHLEDAGREAPELRSFDLLRTNGGEMVSTDLASIERALREIECAELEDFRAGKAEAPVVYRPNIIERANGEDGLMGFVASDESVDRMGDVVRAKGWVLDDFKRNPVFLWAHNASLPAIGAVRQVDVEGRKLMAGVEWAQTVAAQEIKGLYDGGFMRAVSVGFRPIEFAPRSDDEGNFAGFEFKRQELLELSAVPVPANARALRKAFGGFSMTVPDLSALRKAMEDAAPDGAGDRAQEANVSPSPQPSPPGEGPEEHRTLTEQEARDAWVRGVEERLEGLDARLKALEGDATSGESEEVDGGDEEVPAELAEEIAELAGLAAGKE